MIEPGTPQTTPPWLMTALRFNTIWCLCAMSALVLDELSPLALRGFTLLLHACLFAAILGDAFFQERMCALASQNQGWGAQIAKRLWPNQGSTTLWRQPYFWGLVAGAAFACFYSHLPPG